MTIFTARRPEPYCPHRAGNFVVRATDCSSFTPEQAQALPAGHLVVLLLVELLRHRAESAH